MAEHSYCCHVCVSMQWETVTKSGEPRPGLLTGGNRLTLQGRDSEKAQQAVREKVRETIQNEFAGDVALLKEHQPDLFQPVERLGDVLDISVDATGEVADTLRALTHDRLDQYSVSSLPPRNTGLCFVVTGAEREFK